MRTSEWSELWQIKTKKNSAKIQIISLKREQFPRFVKEARFGKNLLLNEGNIGQSKQKQNGGAKIQIQTYK